MKVEWGRSRDQRDVDQFTPNAARPLGVNVQRNGTFAKTAISKTGEKLYAGHDGQKGGTGLVGGVRKRLIHKNTLISIDDKKSRGYKTFMGKLNQNGEHAGWARMEGFQKEAPNA